MRYYRFLLPYDIMPGLIGVHQWLRYGFIIQDDHHRVKSYGRSIEMIHVVMLIIVALIQD